VQLVSLVHDTADRSACRPGLGLATSDHRPPSQCSINVLKSVCPAGTATPTAMQNVALVHATPESWESRDPARFGLATTLHGVDAPAGARFATPDTDTRITVTPAHTAFGTQRRRLRTTTGIHPPHVAAWPHNGNHPARSIRQ